MNFYFVYTDYVGQGEGRTLYAAVYEASSLPKAKKKLAQEIPEYYAVGMRGCKIGTKMCRPIMKKILKKEIVRHIETAFNKEMFLKLHYNHS